MKVVVFVGRDFRGRVMRPEVTGWGWGLLVAVALMGLLGLITGGVWIGS